MTSANSDESSAKVLTDALEALTAKVLDGDEVTDRLLDDFPDHADQLRELLPAIATMRQWGSVLPTEPGIASDNANLAASQPLGDFRIIRELGRGGMGIVYEAEQISLERRVAVKVLPLAALLDTRQLERFKNEARAAAMLKHPNIVSVHAVGCERGVHFYAMEFINGRSLADAIKAIQFPLSLHDTEIATELPINHEADTTPVAQISTQYANDRSGFHRTVTRIGVQAAEAIHFAHEHGVIHRDIKPSNLVLDEVGGVHVADFGLALVQNASELTLTGDVIGTLRYMSPEQVEESSLVDPRTDVYSLGATLYETLCGRPPLVGENRAELLRSVVEIKPTDLRKLDSQIPSDLATVVLKCLAKSPHDRYQTAGELAEDLRRFDEHRPILARKSPVWKNAWRWAQRHKRLAAVTCVALIALLTLSIAGPLAAIKLKNALGNQLDLTRQLRMQNYDMLIRDAAHAIDASQMGRAETVLLTCDQAHRDFEWFHLWSKVEEERRQTIAKHPIDLMRVALSPNCKQVACANWFGHILIYDRDSRKQIARFGLDGVPLALEYSPNGDLLFAGGGKTAILWDTKKTRVAKSWKAKSDICSASISPDSKALAIGFTNNVLAVGSNSQVPTEIRLLDIAQLIDGKNYESDQPGSQLIAGLTGSVNTLRFAPDGQTIAATSNEKSVIRRWAFPSLEALKPITIDDPQIEKLAFYPNDPNILVVASGARSNRNNRSKLSIYSVDERSLQRTIYGSAARTSCLEFSADGARLAIGRSDGLVLSWDAVELLHSTGDGIPATLRPHQSVVYDLAVSSMDTTVISSGADGLLKEYPAQSQSDGLLGHDSFSGGVEFLGDGRAVTWGYGPEGNELKLWRLSDGKPLLELDTADIFVTDVAVLPSGQEIAYTGYTFLSSKAKRADIGIWGVVTGSNRTLHSEQATTSRDLVLSRNGDKLVAGFADRLVVVDVATGGVESDRTFDSNVPIPIARRPDSDVIAVAESLSQPPNRVTLWDLQNSSVVGTLDCGDNRIWSLAFSADGTLAAGTKHGRILVWHDVEEKSDYRELTGHGKNAYHVRFSPSGSRLASAGLDGSVRLWNTTTGNELLLLNTAASWNYRAVFSHNGETLAHAGGKGTAYGPIHFITAKRGVASER